jgi:hypothetical protein
LLDLKLGPLADEVRNRLRRFEAWTTRLVVDDRILGAAAAYVSASVVQAPGEDSSRSPLKARAGNPDP